MPWLINPGQLEKFRKNQKNVIILDASWHLPETGRDPRAEFIQKHIIGARFFDITDYYDKSTDLPNMISHDAALISQKLGELGITNDHKIIFYDNSPLHTSCRALWMMRIFGHNPHQLYLLDGGFSAWEKFGGKVEEGEVRVSSPKKYQVNFEPSLIRTLSQMKENLQHPKEQVVDVRHAVRYAGGKESRPDIRPGHIPGSFSFPYISFFETTGTFKPLDKIRKLLTGVGIDLQAPIVTTCGSGVTSCIMNVTLDLMGNTQNALYDGSWSEWGNRKLYSGEVDLSERPVVRSVDK